MCFPLQCWETRVGQEMYKLTIFDFIIIIAVTIFVEFPRKYVISTGKSVVWSHPRWLCSASFLCRLIVKHCDCGLAKWWGQQEFAIPQNVLEIVYGQTICWIGTFYSPMLPAICTIKYFFIFYIKKVPFCHPCVLFVIGKCAITLFVCLSLYYIPFARCHWWTTAVQQHVHSEPPAPTSFSSACCWLAWVWPLYLSQLA